MILRSSVFFLTLALTAAPADLILTAGKVVTMDSNRRVIDGGAVAVARGRILAVGPRAEIDKQYQAPKRIDRPDAILMPGLINTHTHAAMSLLRGIADDKPLDVWLTRYIFPAEAKNVNEEYVRAGTRLAMLEMMLSGITTYADMYYFEDAVADETRKAGMRGVLGETILGFPAPDHRTPAETLAAIEKFIGKYKSDPLITPAVAPHAPYTNSAETLQAARALADKYSVPLLTHLSETRKEIDDMLSDRRMSPVAFLDSIGAFARRTLVAQCVYCEAPDRAILRTRGIGIAHCPSSNLKLASGIAPVPAMLADGLAVGLGTDGAAGSNNDLDLMEEMDLAAKIQKITLHDPSVMPARVVVEMATIGGAKALGMASEIGSLEPGKRADLITIALDSPRAWPAHDVYSMIVYTLKGRDVRDVVIEGRATILDRKPLTLDPDAIRKEASAFRAKVDASLRQ